MMSLYITIVYICRGDDTYHIPFSDKLKYFMCMKITKVSDDVLYYYLLAGKLDLLHVKL